MKKLFKHFTVGIFLAAGISLGAQTTQAVDFGITAHSLIAIDNPTLSFAFTSPTAGGDGLGSSAAATTQLKYSYMPQNAQGPNNTKIKVQFQNIPSGLSVSLSVDPSTLGSTTSNTNGTLGTVASTFTTASTLSSNATTTIIEGIGASFTGAGYYTLSYLATISNYAALSANPNGANPTITYTISQ